MTEAKFNEVFPKVTFDRAVFRYLRARLDAEVDWTVTGIRRILAAGDAYEARHRLTAAKERLAGIRRFTAAARALESQLAQRAVQREIEIGARYQAAIAPRDTARLQQLIESEPGSAYAAAARYCLENPNAFWPELFYFVMQDTHLNKWSYLTKERLSRSE